MMIDALQSALPLISLYKLMNIKEYISYKYLKIC